MGFSGWEPCNKHLLCTTLNIIEYSGTVYSCLKVLDEQLRLLYIDSKRNIDIWA